MFFRSGIMGKDGVKVFVGGVFDILHVGHLDFLRRAKEFGDELVVVVANDETVKNIKGRSPVNPSQDRLEVIKALRIVDDAIVGHSDDMLKTVKEVCPDIIVLGPDQNFEEEDLNKRLEERNLNCEIKRLTGLHKKERAKSSQIAERILKNYEISDFKYQE